MAECSAGSISASHGVGDVLGRERRAVGEDDALAELEDDRPAAVLDSPGLRELGFELLVDAIDARSRTPPVR